MEGEGQGCTAWEAELNIAETEGVEEEALEGTGSNPGCSCCAGA